MRRPSPAAFARYSYILAFVSSGVVTLAIILSMLKSPLVYIVWLALLTSAIGTFLSSAARSDFKHKQRSVTEEAKHQANVGFRVNLAFLILLLILALIAIVGALNIFRGFGF
jgi:hypothetical protein